MYRQSRPWGKYYSEGGNLAFNGINQKNQQTKKKSGNQVEC